MNEQQLQILKDNDFCESGCTAEEERDMCFDDYKEVYRDYEILLSIPNGGLLAAIIIPPNSEVAYAMSVGSKEDKFGYADEEPAIAHCKSVIDKLIQN